MLKVTKKNSTSALGASNTITPSRESRSCAKADIPWMYIKGDGGFVIWCRCDTDTETDIFVSISLSLAVDVSVFV